MRAHDEPASRHIIPSIFTANSLFRSFVSANCVSNLDPFLHLNAPHWHTYLILAFFPLPNTPPNIANHHSTWYLVATITTPHSFSFVTHIRNASRMCARWNPNLGMAALVTPPLFLAGLILFPFPFPLPRVCFIVVRCHFSSLSNPSSYNSLFLRTFVSSICITTQNPSAKF